MQRSTTGILTTLLLLAASGGNAIAATPASGSGPFDPALFAQLHWRSIGPLRGGRMHALAAVPGNPPIMYAGADNGGIWRTNDYGRTWKPIFDKEPTGSIGSIAVAASDPNIIYVGSGEGIIRPDGALGDGMYKSTDAGKTWTHLGLRDTQKIPRVVVDPHNPNRLFVAAMGHPYGPNKQRGIFRSTDGGKTFQKVLYVDEYTSGDDVAIDPKNPQVVYATMWQQQQAPWENGSFSGTSGGIFKSTDGGSTWKQLTNGLPKDTVQALIAIAPSDPGVIYATIGTDKGVHLYRSDDAGADWRVITKDARPAARIGGGDLPPLTVDPHNPNIVYSSTPVLWQSKDGGKTWTAIRGGPGGDDYQRLWIDPNDSNVLFAVSDQGAIVSVNGGHSWSSWYNQPTAAMYDVATDNHYPYRVCGGQQDSGSACVLSRGNDGQLTAHDWHPVGAPEYGRAVPDPLNPDIVYGGKVTRYNRATGQIQQVGPSRDKDNGRVLRTMPLVFSPIDPHVLYSTSNVVWKTSDGGTSWTEISPDLTRQSNWNVPANVGKYAKTVKPASRDRGVVFALAPSPLDANIIWAGTDDGLIQLTTDGGQHWKNVTPPKMKPWWAVYGMAASHFKRGEAYAAINTMQLDDQNPHLFRTRDFGKTWTEIDNGVAGGEATNVVIEDPERQGLLFAGTETQVFVSFDDGDHWQSLRLNMPAISVRDLTVKGDDLIAATHGRGFQILDDITPLRQIDKQVARAAVTLYKPQVATRVRWGMNPPTPWRMPFQDNPPPGAVIDYYLAHDAHGVVTLDILDAKGNVVRHYASNNPDKPIPLDELRVPAWWPRPPQHLSTEAGEHRYVWNMHYAPIPGLTRQLDGDQAVRDNETPKVATAPWAMPGHYSVRLTVDGHSYTQPMTVRMDPRVKTSTADLQRQFDLSKQAYDEAITGLTALGKIRDLQAQLAERVAKPGAPAALQAYAKKLDELAGPRNAPPFFFFFYKGPPIISGVAFQLRRLMGTVEGADFAPTQGQAAAFKQASDSMQALLAKWQTLKGEPLTRVDAALRKANLQPVRVLADANVPDEWDEPWVKYYRADQ